MTQQNPFLRGRGVYDVAPQTETMNRRSQGIFVACTREAVFVQVVGRGACRNSEALRKYGQRKLNEGFTIFYVDLLHCDGMDSTFLGMFAGLGLALRPAGSLRLLNLSGDNLKAFLDLGLDHLPCVRTSPSPDLNHPAPAWAEFQLLAGTDLNHKPKFDALERAILMLECHEDLCRLDERNEEKFRDVKEFLREDILRHSISEAPPRPRT